MTLAPTVGPVITHGVVGGGPLQPLGACGRGRPSVASQCVWSGVPLCSLSARVFFWTHRLTAGPAGTELPRAATDARGCLFTHSPCGGPVLTRPDGEHASKL